MKKLMMIFLILTSNLLFSVENTTTTCFWYSPTSEFELVDTENKIEEMTKELDVISVFSLKTPSDYLSKICVIHK